MQILLNKSQHYSYRCNTEHLLPGWETLKAKLQSTGRLESIEEMNNSLRPVMERLKVSSEVCTCAPDDLLDKYQNIINQTVTELTGLLTSEHARYFYLLEMVKKDQLWRKINPYDGFDAEETVEELFLEPEWALGKLSQISHVGALSSTLMHWVWTIPYRGQPTSFLWMPVSIARKMTSDMKWESILKREDFTPAKQEILVGLNESDPRGDPQKMLEVALNI